MRIDGKGGSRIVACPECKAPVGERCYVRWTAEGRHGGQRTQSHWHRVNKARETVERRDRKKRVSEAATDGMRDVRDHVSRYVCTTILDAQVQGRGLAKKVALDAIDKLIRTRGARHAR